MYIAVETGKAKETMQGRDGGRGWPIDHGLDFCGVCLYAFLGDNIT